MNLGAPPLPGGAFYSEFRSLQKRAYSLILGELFPDTTSTNLDTICINRVEMLFSPFEINTDGMTHVDLALTILKAAGGHIALKVIKTWLNGWVTSHRMHETPVLPCLFGCCGEKDTLKHYVMCPHIYAFQRFLFADISSDPLVRLGIKHPSIQRMQICSCLFSAYHAVKAKVRSGTISVHEDTLTSPTLRVIWRVFAEALIAEAGGLRVATRAFSLSKFICCLSSGSSLLRNCLAKIH